MSTTTTIKIKTDVNGPSKNLNTGHPATIPHKNYQPPQTTATTKKDNS